MALTKNEIDLRLQKFKRRQILLSIKELLIIAIATLPYGLVINRVLIPHAIVGGGLTGLCEIIYFASGTLIPVWLSTMVINAVLLIIAIYVVGWKFCLRSIYGVLLLTTWFYIIPVAKEPQITDPFMAVILSGLFNGCGLGIIFLNNGSTGGTDIIAMIVNKFRHMPLGRVLLLCDLIIISSAYFLPQVHSIEKVLFGLCYTFMSANAIDWIMHRVRQSVQFLIFSQHYEQIATAIMTKVPRGVTILDGVGGFSKQPVKVIVVLAKRNESNKIFGLVQSIDPDAFVSESQTEGVFGQGFESIKEHTN